MRPWRWPLHPQPGPLESLSSWLERVARLYNLSVDALLTHNLDLGGVAVPALLDHDPPAVLLAALADRTGVELAQLRAMTLGGWVPWLFDSLYVRPYHAQEVFDTYVRANSVLLAPGEAGGNLVSRWTKWSGPWHPAVPAPHRACPVCATDPNQGSALIWRLPLMVGCITHGCRLQDARQVTISIALGEPLEPAPMVEPVATLDRYTYQALATGRVPLPGRAVHAGVWFRLLRALLDEVSLCLTTQRATTRTMLERIWHATGRPERGGLSTWRPYEHLDWDTQEAMLHAAATALQLALDGQITPRGTFGSALRPVPHQHVYDGDRPTAPHKSAWQEAMVEAETAMILARTNRDAARQLLTLLTIGCRTLDRFEEERAYLFGIGIPAAFLPTARELGRDDLA